MIARPHILREVRFPFPEIDNVSFVVHFIPTNQIGGDCVEVHSIDDKEGFSETSRCMESIGLGPDQQEGVFRVSHVVTVLSHVQVIW